MSESSSMPVSGSISWVEIPVQDTDRAMKFYKDVFGWEYITPYSTNAETGEKNTEPDFIMFQKGSTQGSFRNVTSVDHLSPALHPNNADKEKFTVTVVITVDNMEESLKAVETAGGSSYIPRRQIPGENNGYVLYFLDSEKNVLGMFSMN